LQKNGVLDEEFAVAQVIDDFLASILNHSVLLGARAMLHLDVSQLMDMRGEEEGDDDDDDDDDDEKEIKTERINEWIE
jgi:hypothetical protein